MVQPALGCHSIKVAPLNQRRKRSYGRSVVAIWSHDAQPSISSAVSAGPAAASIVALSFFLAVETNTEHSSNGIPHLTRTEHLLRRLNRGSVIGQWGALDGAGAVCCQDGGQNDGV